MSHQLHTYTGLKQQIHEDLRAQHPEWVHSTGECSKCDEHEARLRELLDALGQSEPDTEAEQRAFVEDSNDPTSP
jgi:hypothetical protein